MKKILIFSLAYFPRVGGAEVAIKEITDRIPDIEFHLITLRFSPADARSETIGNVHVHRIGKGSDSYLSKIFFIPDAAAATIQLHAKEKFDGAWAMMSYMLFPLMLARVMGVLVPYALTLQEGDTYSHMFARLRILPFLPLLRVGFKQATIVSAISNYLGVWARKRGFKGPLELVPNGVDIQKFKGESVAHEGIVLIHTGRLVHKNALDDIVRALPLVPEVRLQLVGDGPDKKSLEQLAKQLHVETRVTFTPYVTHEQLPRLLHSADIFIRPSRTEGMGNSFIEAMAAGIPVIATQEGGIADFLFDAARNPTAVPTGWAVDTDSPGQIAAAIKEILSNPDERAQVITNAEEMVTKSYDWDVIARAMREKVFSRLFV